MRSKLKLNNFKNIGFLMKISDLYAILLFQNFSVAISVSPHVCFILVLILIYKFLR